MKISPLSSLLRAPSTLTFSSLLLLAIAACSASNDSPGGGGGGAKNDKGGDDGLSEEPSGEDEDPNTQEKPPAQIEHALPPGFTKETHNGGWRLVGPLAEYEAPDTTTCANVLRAVIRDHSFNHVDFGSLKPATWEADKLDGHYVGLVQNRLGNDGKPALVATPNPAELIEHFADWYNDSAGDSNAKNVPYVLDMWLEPKQGEEGTFIFRSENFFPVDELIDSLPQSEIYELDGTNELGEPIRIKRNFLFTTEIHTAFEYKGGETFTFYGDDDVWVFINGKLAVDLGGIHGPIEGSVDLDARAEEFGISVGGVYSLDLFQAERNPHGSWFKIETSLDFKECGIKPIVPR